MKRSSGILAHPTSFPSRYGIGDFGKGAYDFLDYCYDCGQELWQVLPLGPTIYGDSPYQSFSTFAGNTLLISPDNLVDEGYLSPEDIDCPPAFPDDEADYGIVIEYKNELYGKAYENFKSKGTAEQKAACEKFAEKNKFWLDDYALFRALKTYFIEERKYDEDSDEYLYYRKLNKSILTESEINDYYYGAVWNSWPRELIAREKDALELWRVKLDWRIGYEKFLQYEFSRQWGKLREYAGSLGISVIGDIPIFVAMDSSDVWADPHLFLLDEAGNPTVVAGVPPDYFSETGQLWGNPLYNWQEHEKDGYDWWIRRIENSLGLVDILRIDHFRGFDEYWATEYGEKTAINGEWRPGPGLALFNALHEKLGDAPIIAEDLGLLTDSVVELRKKTGYPGMKVLQFAFSGGAKNEYLPHSYTEDNSVVYTGTHDNDTTIGWYNSETEEVKDLLRRYMNVSAEQVNWDMIRLAFSSVAKYAIVPIQDLFGLGSEGRMNKPGIPSGWWRYRFKGDMLNDYIKEKLLYLGEMFDRLPDRLTEELEPDEEELETDEEDTEEML